MSGLCHHNKSKHFLRKLGEPAHDSLVFFLFECLCLFRLQLLIINLVFLNPFTCSVTRDKAKRFTHARAFQSFLGNSYAVATYVPI